MKRKKTVWLICIICTIGIALTVATTSVFSSIYSKNKAAEQEEVRRAQEVAEQHLKETYDEEMVCYDSRKTCSLMHGVEYICKFYPKDAPELMFEVHVFDDFSGADDDYLKVRAEAVLQPVYQTYASEIWGDGVQVTVIGRNVRSKHLIESDSAVELVAHSPYELDITLQSDLTEENLHETAVQIDAFRNLLGEKELMPFSLNMSFHNRVYCSWIYPENDTLAQIEEELSKVCK